MHVSSSGRHRDFSGHPGPGDGRKDAGAVSSANGAGSVSGQHAFRKPGIHMVTLTVTDNKGRSTTVKHGVTI